jgi:uncharacterized membrane protein YgcG
MKSGGGTPRAPDDVEPQGNNVPYGQASAFSPQYQSFLPQDGSVAQLGDPVQQQGGIITPLQQQQEAIIAAQALQAAQPQAARPSPREQFIQMIMDEQRQRKSPGGFGGGSGGGFSHGDRGASYGGRSGKGGLY